MGPSGHDVALVECPPYHQPVYLVDGNAKELYVRAGNTTRLLDVAEAVSYVGQHWRGKAIGAA